MSADNPFAAPTSGPREDLAPDKFERAAAKLRSVAKGYWILPVCVIGYGLLWLAVVIVMNQRPNIMWIEVARFWDILEGVLGVAAMAFVLVGAFWSAMVTTRLVHPLAGVVVGIIAFHPVTTAFILLPLWWYAARRLKQAGYRVGWFRATPPPAQLEN